MRNHSFMQSLEPRRLLAADLDDGVLVVTGTSGGDDLEFSETIDDIVVNLNGEEERFHTTDVRLILVDVGSGADSVILGNRNVPAHVRGGRGNDSLSGGLAKDTLLGEGADDYLFGNAGNDLLDGGGEADLILGGAGKRDLVDYSTRTGDLDIDLSGDDEDDGEAGENDSVLTDVEIVFGGVGDDDIRTQSSRACSLFGGNGDDTLTGGSGDNVLVGGNHEDRLFGNAGNDTFFTEDGDADTLSGGTGTDAADRDNAIDVATGIEQNL